MHELTANERRGTSKRRIVSFLLYRESQALLLGCSLHLHLTCPHAASIVRVSLQFESRAVLAHSLYPVYRYRRHIPVLRRSNLYRCRITQGSKSDAGIVRLETSGIGSLTNDEILGEAVTAYSETDYAVAGNLIRICLNCKADLSVCNRHTRNPGIHCLSCPLMLRHKSR